MITLKTVYAGGIYTNVAENQPWISIYYCRTSEGSFHVPRVLSSRKILSLQHTSVFLQTPPLIMIRGMVQSEVQNLLTKSNQVPNAEVTVNQ